MFWVKTSLESEARSKQINKKCGFSCYAGVRVTLARIYPTTGGLVIYRWMLYTGTPHHGCKPHPPTGGCGDKQTYMYLYIYIYYTCMHACMHACIHSYIQTDLIYRPTTPHPRHRGGGGTGHIWVDLVYWHTSPHTGGGGGIITTPGLVNPCPLGEGGPGRAVSYILLNRSGNCKYAAPTEPLK